MSDLAQEILDYVRVNQAVDVRDLCAALAASGTDKEIVTAVHHLLDYRQLTLTTDRRLMLKEVSG